MSEYNIQMNRYNALNVEYDQLYPATKIENVDGLDTALQNKASKTHASQHASGGADPVTPDAIGAAAAIHTHAAGDIISGILAISRGGTGVASLDELKTLLGISDTSCKLEYGTYTGNGDATNNNIQLSFKPNMLIILGGVITRYSADCSVSFLFNDEENDSNPGMTIFLAPGSNELFISTFSWSSSSDYGISTGLYKYGYSIGKSGTTDIPNTQFAKASCIANKGGYGYKFLAIG